MPFRLSTDEGEKPVGRARGWLFDVYPARRTMVLWVILEDGRRLRLLDSFPLPFYIQAPPKILPALIETLHRSQSLVPRGFVERRDLWTGRAVRVLEVAILDHDRFPRLFRKLAAQFPNASFYNCDLDPAHHYLILKDLFPLAFCEVAWDDRGVIQTCEALDSSWDTTYRLPPLVTLELEGSVRGQRVLVLEVSFDGRCLIVEEGRAGEVLRWLGALLLRHDPDLILTRGGDTCLIPALLTLARRAGVSLPLDREPVERRIIWEGSTFFTYGRVQYRGPDYPLFGRWHLDRENSFFLQETDLEGLFELARLTKLPVQRLARRSIGTGMTALQLDQALQEGILIPWKKIKAEDWKTAEALLIADKGGLVYQPKIGLHEEAAELDFASMYPALMVRENISPETVACRCCHEPMVPETGYTICQKREGLIPRVLRPLLERRQFYKQQMGEASGEARAVWDRRQTALKWIMVSAFGYLGFKNARFGRIEAHEAVTAFGRERLLQAKEIAEANGYEVLHAMVDALWVKPAMSTVESKAGAKEEDLRRLCELISQATGLSINLEGIYRWISFLPSVNDPRVPVPNRYVGVFIDGRVKGRGLLFRRHDTPPLIREVQERMLAILAEAADLEGLRRKAPEVLKVFEAYGTMIREGRVRLQDLVITRTLSKAPHEYRRNDPLSLAARQLARHGARLHPGEPVSFLFVNSRDSDPESRVRAAPLLDGTCSFDPKKYLDYLLKAAEELLEPLGYRRPTLLQALKDST